MYKNKKLSVNVCGGGGRGIWQAGSLKAIHDLGLSPEFVFGTSVGGLNGALYMQGDLDLMEWIWLNVQNDWVYKWHLWTIPNLIINRSHLYDSTPLFNLLKKYVKYDSIVKNPARFSVTATNCNNWNSESLTPQECTEEEFITWLWASASASFYFQKTLFRGNYYADGGLANNFNVQNAVKAGAELIILTTPTVPDLDLPENILDELDLVTSLPSYDYLPRETDYIDLINTFTEKFPAGQSTIKHVLVRPPEALKIGLIDFSWSGDRKAMIKAGYDTTMETLGPWLDKI